MIGRYNLLLLLSAAIAVFSTTHASRRDDARLFAALSTWTTLSFVTFTTIQPTTCHIAANTAPCRRRKLRKFIRDMTNDKDGLNLDSSFPKLDDPKKISNPDTEIKDPKGKNRGKFAVTVYTSITSTYTMTMTSINVATTFSISYFCSISDANIVSACG